MTIEQAIDNATKLAVRYELEQLTSCANEQRQIVGWLRELKEYRAKENKA